MAGSGDREWENLPWQPIHAQENDRRQHQPPLLSGSLMKQLWKIHRAVNLWEEAQQNPAQSSQPSTFPLSEIPAGVNVVTGEAGTQML